MLIVIFGELDSYVTLSVSGSVTEGDVDLSHILIIALKPFCILHTSPSPDDHDDIDGGGGDDDDDDNDNNDERGGDDDDNDDNDDDGDDDDDDNDDHLPSSRPHMAQGRIPRCTQALAERN